MRDINRIEPFLKAIGEEWKKYPDLRFGQLMEILKFRAGDLFHYEEKAFLKLLKDFMKENEIHVK